MQQHPNNFTRDFRHVVLGSLLMRVLQCLAISRWPTASQKCALALTFLLAGWTVSSAQPAEGKIRSNRYNFEYQIPDKSWIAVDAKRFNTNAIFAIMHDRPYASFMIIAQDPGVEADNRLELLVESVKAAVENNSTAHKILTEKEIKLKEMTGRLIELEFELNHIRFFSSQTIFSHNGYIYQLIARGTLKDQDFVRKEAARLFDSFSLANPDNLAHSQAKKVLKHFHSPFGYDVDLTGAGWQEWSSGGRAKSPSEFGVLYKSSGALIVVPFPLEGLNPQWDAVVAAALARLDIAASDERLIVKPRVRDLQTKMTNVLYGFQRTVDTNVFNYRLLITRNKNCAYFVAAWCAAEKGIPDRFPDDAIDMVSFDTDLEVHLPDATEWTQHRKEVQSFFLNDIGISYFNENAYDTAQSYFRLARELNPKNKTFAVNIVEAYSRLKQYDKALTAIEQSKDVYAESDWLAQHAYLLMKTDRVDEALKEFEIVFKDDYQNETFFNEYLNLLFERGDLDGGLKQVERHLATKDSIRLRLWQAAFFREKKEFDKAIAVLQEQRTGHPSSKDVLFALWDSYHAAGRDEEALELCEELLKKGTESARVYFLKGRSELVLKRYREAKASFETALKKNPGDEDAKALLDRVSGMLGEGDNSAIKTAIAPVPIPDAVFKNVPANPAATNKEYSAHYVKSVEAISFEKGKEQKQTQSATVVVHDATAVRDFSSLEFSFDPLSEEIFINELMVKDAEGKTVWVGKASDYYVLDQGGEMAHQKKTLHAPISGLQPGYTIDWTVTHRRLGAAKSFDYFKRTFSTYYPVDRSAVLLSGDIAGVKWEASPDVKQRKIDGALCWQVDSPQVFRFESLQPSLASCLPYLWLCDSSSTWTEEAKDYLKSIEEKLVLDSATRSLAEKQVLGSTKPMEKAIRLAQFVQTNLTYKAIEFGRRARIPNAADKVFENRYGDCKDHALALHQLLQSVGIASHLALVNSSELVKKGLPTIDQFDHMILYAPGLGSGTFFDCTEKCMDPAEAALADLPDRLALILDPANPHLAPIPTYPSNVAETRIDRELTVESDLDAVMNETITFDGYNAAYFRALLKNVEPTRWKTTIQKEYAETSRSVSVESVEVKNLNDFTKPFSVEVKSRGKNIFHDVNGSLSGKVPVSWELLYLPADPVAKREMPFQIRRTQVVKSSTKIVAPPGYRLRVTSGMKQDAASEFTRCHAEAQVVSSKATAWQYEFRRLANTYPASAYGAYDQAVSKASQILQPDFVFEKAKE